MTDAEWNSWQSGWTGATGPLPDVRAREQKEVRLHRLAKVAFFILIAIALAALVPVFDDRSPAVHFIGWTIIAFCAAMSIGYLSIQRGIRLSSAGNPRDALAFLERRLRFARLTAHLIRWVYAGVSVVFLFVFQRAVAGHRAAWLQKAITDPCRFA